MRYPHQAVEYVVWGNGSFTILAGVTQMITVIPTADGSYAWQARGLLQ